MHLHWCLCSFFYDQPCSIKHFWYQLFLICRFYRSSGASRTQTNRQAKRVQERERKREGEQITIHWFRSKWGYVCVTQIFVSVPIRILNLRSPSEKNVLRSSRVRLLRPLSILPVATKRKAESTRREHKLHQCLCMHLYGCAGLVMSSKIIYFLFFFFDFWPSGSNSLQGNAVHMAKNLIGSRTNRSFAPPDSTPGTCCHVPFRQLINIRIRKEHGGMVKINVQFLFAHFGTFMFVKTGFFDAVYWRPSGIFESTFIFHFTKDDRILSRIVNLSCLYGQLFIVRSSYLNLLKSFASFVLIFIQFILAT